jgi:2-polyprenyl-3-methyl-5-hydroxy-6-metoxy-1,4-benzoquinol methylase
MMDKYPELKQAALNEIENLTLDHYNVNAKSFWEGTRDHDVSQNIQAFLSALPKKQHLDILDFGCGPGRDLFTFKEMGHRVVGLDGSGEFCEMAKQHANCEVLHQNFLNIELEYKVFDGVFANASLFHIPSSQLTSVLGKLQQAIRVGGVLFASIPRGSAEGWNGSRYGHYMEIDVMTSYLERSGFQVLHHYYRPSGLPIDQQPWLAVVSQKMD